jgi:ubiquinone/menaquinone biosynthesis C-methylase UbiE
MAKTKPFDRYTTRYEQWFELNRYTYESEISAVQSLLPAPAGNGLEIGVGSGLFAEPLGIRHGIDPSDNMRELARRRGIEAVKGVAESLPYEDSRFDFALMVTTICFLDDTEAALREAYRVIKQGGSIISGFVDRESALGKQYLEHREESLFYRIATFYSVDEVVSFLEKAGFRDFRFKQTVFHALHEVQAVEPVKEGYGEGSFVVVRARKERMKP